MFCRCMYGRLINCKGTCVLQGNVYGLTQMSAYCIISAGYVLWGGVLVAKVLQRYMQGGEDSRLYILQHYRIMYWLCMY